VPTFEHYSQQSKDFFLLLLDYVKHLGGLDAHLQNKRGEDLFVFLMTDGNFEKGWCPPLASIGLVSHIADRRVLFKKPWCPPLFSRTNMARMYLISCLPLEIFERISAHLCVANMVIIYLISCLPMEVFERISAHLCVAEQTWKDLFAPFWRLRVPVKTLLEILLTLFAQLVCFLQRDKIQNIK
jgi:hypothetical protein